MIINGQISDTLGFLKILDEYFRDRNADQDALVCLNACKKSSDESLASFWPRFRKILSRSIPASAVDRHKIYELDVALN